MNRQLNDTTSPRTYQLCFTIPYLTYIMDYTILYCICQPLFSHFSKFFKACGSAPQYANALILKPKPHLTALRLPTLFDLFWSCLQEASPFRSVSQYRGAVHDQPYVLMGIASFTHLWPSVRPCDTLKALSLLDGNRLSPIYTVYDHPPLRQVSR